jgi:hypoxanthine phosphoribosyltransferase
MLPVDAINAVFERSQQLYSAEEVHQAIDKVADEMTTALQEKNPVLLCVLVGGIMPMGYLLDRFDFPLQVDYVHATRYNNSTRGNTLEWIARPRTDLTNRCVVIIDDVLDGGVTLAEVVKWCEAQGAQEVLTMALIDKKAARVSGGLEKVDFTALSTEDHYLFGFGLDYKGYLRNAPGIYALDPSDQ